jgi:uncharacterized repeat protein (TIGR01451 family)
MIEYRIVVTNRGPAPAFQVVLSDSLPEALAYVPATITVNGVLLTDEADDDGADYGVTAPSTVTANLGDLSVEDTVIVTLAVRPKQAHAGAMVTNTAVVSSLSLDEESSNNEAQAEITVKVNTSTEPEIVPETFALRPNYPNPFNPGRVATTIAFDIPRREHVRLTILNVLGQPVDVLVDGTLNAGRYSVPWNAARVASSGLYFYRLEAGRNVATRSMLLLK